MDSAVLYGVPNGSVLGPILFLNKLNCRNNITNISYAGCPIVYLEWFRRNSFLKCVLQPQIAENSLKPPYFGGSRSLEVIDVGTTGKLVAMLEL